jgi:hypothetical protein
MKKRKKTSPYWILNFERGESLTDAGLPAVARGSRPLDKI